MPANEVDLQRQAARLGTSVREAGALALSMFKTPLKNWTKGEAQSPVSDADIAVDNLLRARLTDDSIAWLSEESVDDPVRRFLSVFTAKVVQIPDLLHRMSDGEWELPF